MGCCSVVDNASELHVVEMRSIHTPGINFHYFLTTTWGRIWSVESVSWDPSIAYLGGKLKSNHNLTITSRVLLTITRRYKAL